MKRYPYFFRNAFYVREYERFLGPIQTMHAQNKMFEDLTVAQTTGRKFSVVKLRKLQNVLGKGETEYCAS